MYHTLIRFSVAITLVTSMTGCCLFRGRGHAEHLSASQLRSQELFAENENLVLAQNQLQQTVTALDQERQMLANQLGQIGTQLATANSRIDNLMAERNELKDRYANSLRDTSSDAFITAGPLPDVSGFQRDPLTGLNKFPEDILFDLGSAELRSEAMPILKEFAAQVNSGGAQGMRLLIVGHTDDQRIARSSTAAKHPTNWHLSTDRANQIITVLEQLGVEPDRMAAMGYSQFQPLEASTDEPARQRNRRVELDIVPESQNVASWDPVRSLN